MSLLKKIFLFALLLGVCAALAAAQPRPRNQPAPNNQGKANTLFEAGQDAHAAGKLEEAIKLYGQALALDENLWPAELQRANAYFALRRLPEAATSIKHVLAQLREFSDTPELKNVQAKAATLQAEIALAAGQFDEAEAAYQQVLQVNAQNKSAQLGLAQIFLHKNKVSEAIAAAEAARAAGEDSALLFSLLGNALVRAKKYDEALTNLTAALTREPDNVQTLRDRVVVWLARQDVPHAIADLQIIVARSKDAAAMRQLAVLYRTTKQFAEASKLYQLLADNDPTDQAARAALAEILIETGQAENAIKELENLLQAQPNRADLHAHLAVLLLAAQPEKALEQYQIAAKLEPQNLNHQIGIGSAFVKQQQFAEAVAILKPLMTQSLQGDQAYTAQANLATALFELKDYQNAARIYLGLLNYLARQNDQKRSAVAVYFLAVCFDRLTDFAQALKAYQQFLSLATAEQQLEVEKVKLRLPALQRQIAQGQGMKNKKKER